MERSGYNMLAASHCAYCCVLLHPFSFISQPRGLIASEVHQEVIPTAIYLKRMARMVDGNTGKYTKVGSITG
jgi:hypothetical protein